LFWQRAKYLFSSFERLDSSNQVSISASDIFSKFGLAAPVATAGASPFSASRKIDDVVDHLGTNMEASEEPLAVAGQ
jgi:hypothetical protein